MKWKKNEKKNEIIENNIKFTFTTIIKNLLYLNNYNLISYFINIL